MDESTASELEHASIPDEHIKTVVQAALQMSNPPRATYRIQLHKDFTFRDATAIVPYLADLGVSHLYASPHLKASPGSTHGYDVIDYGQLNPEIGTEDDYAKLLETLRLHDMSMIMDFVPNHMGIAGGQNAWWQDVLENGQTSAYASTFDIEWQPLKPELRNKVLLPVLGDHYGAVLENGELDLTYADGQFSICYYDLPLPIAPPTYPAILDLVIAHVRAQLAEEDLDLLDLISISTAFERLAPQTETNAEPIEERQREQIVAKRRLAQIESRVPAVAEGIRLALERFNGVAGEPDTFDLLDALLAQQTYRLSYWKVASEEINYRRFFAINELAAIRQEEAQVFDATHALVLRYLGDGRIGGLRIDHPDGLLDPAGYFRQLQRAVFLARARTELERSGLETDAWPRWSEALGAWWDKQWSDVSRRAELSPLYVLIEKILEHGEELPLSWPVSGTVGYEFAQVANGLFVDARASKAFDDLYSRFIDDEIDFATLVYDSKKLILNVTLASELNVLARALDRITERHRRTRDFTLSTLRTALEEVIACFPVYRSYAECEGLQNTRDDRKWIEMAIRGAKRRNRAIDPSVFEFLLDVLLFKMAADSDEETRRHHCRFVMKFQQLTGPVMAKGLEDTAFYIYYRLASLNEVGGDPGAFGVAPQDVHAANVKRLQQWPHAMLASSTHDTKRSEDVRLRIDALSEMPRDWRLSLNRWARLNRKHKTRIEGRPAPDRNDEYLLYQTLLGAWPSGEREASKELIERLDAYMQKAVREAQIHSSWVSPDEDYEGATSRFLRSLLDRDTSEVFLEDFLALQRRVERAGWLNGLAHQLLKLTAPGVPDIYQGTELWDFSLVDPDNRRPVDFKQRRSVLAKTSRANGSMARQKLIANPADGAIKLFLTQRVLRYRCELAELFAHGTYEPLETVGPRRDKLFAFARRHESQVMLVILPRLASEGLLEDRLEFAPGFWEGTGVNLPADLALPVVTNLFTGTVIELELESRSVRLDVEGVLADFPVSLLTSTVST